MIYQIFLTKQLLNIKITMVDDANRFSSIFSFSNLFINI